ncbi:MAG TPA: ArsR family transcriptional regulator [Kribbella sp.]|jgi:hypothetical protein
MSRAPLGDNPRERAVSVLPHLAERIHTAHLVINAIFNEAVRDKRLAGGEAYVCGLTGAFELTAPTISHHLKALKQAAGPPLHACLDHAGGVRGDAHGAAVTRRTSPSSGSSPPVVTWAWNPSPKPGSACSPAKRRGARGGRLEHPPHIHRSPTEQETGSDRWPSFRHLPGHAAVHTGVTVGLAPE